MSAPRSQRAQRRENPEPSEGQRPVPRLVVVWIGLLLLWGIGYYAWHIGAPLTGGDSRTAVERAAPGAAVNGETLFTAQCAACHQPTGQGVPGTFPPLAGSRWLLGDPALPVAIVNDGLSGPISVAGDDYRGTMPAFGDKLSAEELAAVLSYARGAWGNAAGAVAPALVKQHRQRHGERGAWTAQKLTERFDTPAE
ncbi:c-type cytochrome [Halomonas sp.]|uniref:c-type cytochrome n=1 Tax=Halomonas sp. TaxID=1486246 RepID=UPI003D09EA34